MKNRIIAFILLVSTLLALLTSCGNYNGPVRPTDSISSDGSIPDTVVDSIPDSVVDSMPTTDSGGNDTSVEDDPTKKEFKVSLIYNNEPFTKKPTNGQPIVVTWDDGLTFPVTSNANENGVATTKGLDGDYTVRLSNLPDGYTYDPNSEDNITTNDKREIKIKVYALGSGTGKGSGPYSAIVLKATSVYRATLNSDEKKIYFEFAPRKSGTYTIESWIDITDNKVNPLVDIYTSNPAYRVYQYTKDDGGASNSYTKNFKYEVHIANEQISTGGQVVFTFAIHATAKNESYFPTNIDFAIKYEGGFELDHTQGAWMVPADLYAFFGQGIKQLTTLTYEQLYGILISSYSVDQINEIYTLVNQFDDYGDTVKLHALMMKNSFIYAYGVEYFNQILSYLEQKNAGATWRGAEKVVKGKSIFDGDMYRYNEETGFYHLYDETKYATSEYGKGYGPVLYANIASNCRFLDTPFISIEYRGNKALTVNEGTENFKLVVEGYRHAESMSQSVYGSDGCGCPTELIGLLGYNDFVNADGNVPVTPEVKDFLQKYSVNQRLFMDGNGWAETVVQPTFDAAEDDQWLFACGYYE